MADEAVLIKCIYSRDRIVLPGRKKLRTDCLVDIKSFDGTDEPDNNWDKKAANELELIAKALGALVAGRQTLKVSVKEES